MTESKNEDREKTGLRWLSVEDLAANQRLIELFLRHLPIHLDKAENGQEALEMYQKEPYDGILMDIQMPVMDGLEATQKIREWERRNELPAATIIALTALASEEQQQCLEAGCTGVLSKPIRKKELIEKLGNGVDHG